MKRLTLIIALFLLLLAGCNAAGNEPTAEETVSEPTPTTGALEEIEPTETPVPTEAPIRPTPTEETTMIPEASTGPVIIVKRSGGLAGLEDQWTIYADGTVEGAITTENPLSTELIAGIVTKAETGGFFDLEDEYIDDGHCCDFFNYEVTINLADGRSKTITTVEQTPSQPPILTEIINDINFLLFHEEANP